MKKGFLDDGTASPPGSPHSPTPSPATTSTANRGAAEELVTKAQQKCDSGDDGAAMKLVLKSLRLCSTERGQRLKLHLEKFGDGSPAANEVQRVMNSPANHYAIMGLMPNCTAAEVKKAYKQLSLILHPDRNHARGAENAFKRLSEAFRVLSDANERAAHDRTSRSGGFNGYGGSGSHQAHAQQAHTQAEAFVKAERERQEALKRQRDYEANKRAWAADQTKQRSQQQQQQRSSQPPPSTPFHNGSRPNGAQSSADSSEAGKLRATLAELKTELALLRRQESDAHLKATRMSSELQQARRERDAAKYSEDTAWDELKKEAEACKEHAAAVDRQRREEVTLARAQGEREAAAAMRELRERTEALASKLAAEQEALVAARAEARAFKAAFSYVMVGDSGMGDAAGCGSRTRPTGGGAGSDGDDDGGGGGGGGGDGGGDDEPLIQYNSEDLLLSEMQHDRASLNTVARLLGGLLGSEGAPSTDPAAVSGAAADRIQVAARRLAAKAAAAAAEAEAAARAAETESKAAEAKAEAAANASKEAAAKIAFAGIAAAKIAFAAVNALSDSVPGAGQEARREGRGGLEAPQPPSQASGLDTKREILERVAGAKMPSHVEEKLNSSDAKQKKPTRQALGARLRARLQSEGEASQDINMI